MFADLIWFHQFQLDEDEVELRDHNIAAGQHGFHHLTQASFCIARSGNDQRLRALRGQHCIQQHRGNARAVIRVDMREDDGVERGVLDPGLL